ncbi:hypothetical protein QL093DRAFT_1485201 [Fusarium oxysporum]|nr:hypothetical protein QL093DRAFT_1485201 [Fusarium oxysporum]
MKPRDGKDATQDIFYVILITALFYLYYTGEEGGDGVRRTFIHYGTNIGMVLKFTNILMCMDQQMRAVHNDDDTTGNFDESTAATIERIEHYLTPDTEVPLVDVLSYVLIFCC